MTVDQLRRRRPRNRLLRLSLAAALLIAIAAWLAPAALLGSTARAAANLQRFWSMLRFDFDSLVAAALNPGATALAQTLAIAIAAILLAAISAAIVAPLAARGPLPGHRLGAPIVRAQLVLSRALPEYLLAFLLLAVLGAGPWAAVLALALHNFGILGRLYAELLESLPPGPTDALHHAGVRRYPALLFGAAATVLPRYLAYLLYRFELCLREATVLGMLGIVSLGSLVQEARAATRYEEMGLFVGLGAATVVAADLVSERMRRAIR